MLLSLASCSWLVSAVPLMAATISSLAPLVIWFSIWLACVGMSSSAYCRSTLYPASSSAFFTLLPSAIQRSDDFVGIVTPTRAPAVSPPLLLSVVFADEPQATSAAAIAKAPPAATIRATLMPYLLLRTPTSSARTAALPGMLSLTISPANPPPEHRDRTDAWQRLCVFCGKRLTTTPALRKFS